MSPMIAAFLFASLVSQPTPAELAQFEEGSFQVPLAIELVPSPSARAELIALAEKLAEVEDPGAKEVYQWIHFARDHRLEGPALTAKLLAALVCHGDVKPAHTGAIRLLDEIRDEHPDSWQAAVAPFVKARLLYDGPRHISEEARLDAARDALACATADPDATLPEDNQEVDIFLRFFGKGRLERRLQASAMLALADIEYARTLDRVAWKRQPLDDAWRKAKVAYAAVRDAYPDSRAARSAEEMLETVRVHERRGLSTDVDTESLDEPP